MNNLLLITDVARLQKIFSRLTGNKDIRLRIVNNLEKGGEEIAAEKPDAVFVQTHLSGLSADILLMHLKKQLGRKHSRFVLLASADQTSDSILKPFHGWLDTSNEDSLLLSELQQLLAKLPGKQKKNEAPAGAKKTVAAADLAPQEINSLPLFPVATPHPPEPSLEEQGVTYAPRRRMSVYSEFNSSFDSAVSSTPEPEHLEQATPPTPAHDWNAENIETKSARSIKGTFLLWLVPVVVAVVVITYFQQQRSVPKPEPAVTKTVPSTVAVPAAQTPAAVPRGAAEPGKVPADVPKAAVKNMEQLSDKAVLADIAKIRGAKSPAPAAYSEAPLTSLPDFIPRDGFDKKFGAANPGWERYKGRVTEFKVLREGNAIKAIQILDQGGKGVPESFMKSVLRQVAEKPVPKLEVTEKKDGYEIQRGSITEKIKVVYYRDENGGTLRALVLTWQ